MYHFLKSWFEAFKWQRLMILEVQIRRKFIIFQFLHHLPDPLTLLDTHFITSQEIDLLPEVSYFRFLENL